LWAIGTSAYAGEPVDISKYTAEQAAELAFKLLDYGMWRQEQDSTSFPLDVPKQGESYELVTGNALHPLGPVSPLAKGDMAPRQSRSVVTEKVISTPVPVVQARSEPEPDICQGRGKRSYRQHGHQVWRCRR
jgi:hypothetical protein